MYHKLWNTTIRKPFEDHFDNFPFPQELITLLSKTQVLIYTRPHGIFLYSFKFIDSILRFSNSANSISEQREYLLKHKMMYPYLIEKQVIIYCLPSPKRSIVGSDDFLGLALASNCWSSFFCGFRKEKKITSKFSEKYKVLKNSHYSVRNKNSFLYCLL